MTGDRSAVYGYAQTAYGDMIRHFWDAEHGHILNTHGGRLVNHDPIPVWEFGTVIQAMATMHRLTSEEDIRRKIAAQWAYMQRVFTDRQLTATGRDCNAALDDAAWTAMALMTIYRFIGDEKALRLCRAMIRRSYDYWRDGTVGNGLWYCYRSDVDNRYEQKTLYCAGLLLSGLEYHELTRGSQGEDPLLYRETKALYDWVERYLLRDGREVYTTADRDANDRLYYISLYDRKAQGVFQPERYGDQTLSEHGSFSSLMGNTAMAVIHKKMYDLTGERRYLERAVETANAIANGPYNHNGVLVDDFDPWTNATFIGRFAGEVLPLPDIDPRWVDLMAGTAESIMARARTADGHYQASWEGSGYFDRFNEPGGYDLRAEVMMPSVNAVHVVLAAALA